MNTSLSALAKTINTINTCKTEESCEPDKSGVTGKTANTGENINNIKTGNYRFTVILIFLITILSCDREITQFDGSLPEEPVNLADFNSEYDDKCPFIYGNIMVFASNRPGGFGGYDLYFSRLVNDQWSAPVNFGEKINTPHDEYRPVLIDEHVDNSKYMMVFSSTGRAVKEDLTFILSGLRNKYHEDNHDYESLDHNKYLCEDIAYLNTVIL